MSWLDYDPKKADEAGDGGNREPIPVGTEVPVRISGYEVKNTRTGGVMVILEFAVVAGPHKKRRFWHNLHTVNKNENMQHRDRRTLQDIAKIVHADISGGPDSLANLRGRDLLCTVIEHEEDEYNGKVRIKERLGKFRTDPEATNTASSFDDDDVPF
jgi:hypothetical protein